MHRTPNPRVPAIAVLVFAIAAVAGAPRAQGDDPPEAPSKPARLDSFSFKALDDTPLSWDADSGRLKAKESSAVPAVLFVHVFQPDCGKCAELARALDALAAGAKRVAAVGIAHRRGKQEAQDFIRRTKITYPVAVGTGGTWAKRWSRGDPLYIVGADGRIIYRQTGFRADDVDRWKAVVADLLADRPARYSGASRKKLVVGDPLPRIKLPDLLTAKPIALTQTEGELVFRDVKGATHKARASLGFFSRY